MASDNGRALALEIVMQTMEKGEYCDKALHQVLEAHPHLDRRDRAFITRLAEGTIERCLELDYVINRYSKTPVAMMKPAVRNILRISTYQIMYMDQVPDSAACNEGVKLTVVKRVMPLKGFVNGVLRNIARFQDDVEYPSRKKNVIQHFAVWHSMPTWIVSRFLDSYGETETEKVLQTFLEEEKPTMVRCNLAIASREQIIQSLEGQGAQIEAGHFFDYALRIRGYGRLTELDAFEKGWIQVQDESSMLVGQVAGVDKDDQVLDVCAAPGGKSLHLADIMTSKARTNGEEEASGKITACDISAQKVTMIRQNLIRTGTHVIKLKKNDALKQNEEWKGQFDIVVADLPCSGLGVIGKKCDIKYKTEEKDIAALARQQQRMLQVVSEYVKPGGTLIYSTCTIAKEENEVNVEWIKDNLPFDPVSIEEKLPEVLQGSTGTEGYIQVLPDMADTDGFFVSKFVRREQS